MRAESLFVKVPPEVHAVSVEQFPDGLRFILSDGSTEFYPNWTRPVIGLRQNPPHQVVKPR
jgi:hypothetical protein